MSEQRKVPRVLSCLIKGPLGCLAFLIGALVVLVLLLPMAGGRLADRLLEGSFAEQYQGTVELGDAWLGSLYGPQTIESLILRDPDGEEVLRAELRAPALSQIFGPEREAYGPIEIHVKAMSLVQFADGSTNLERALRERPSAGEPGASGLRTDSPFMLSLAVVLDRLQCTDAHGDRGLLENLSLEGTLALGPEGTELDLEGGSDPRVLEPLHAWLELARPAPGRVGSRRTSLRVQGAPSALLDMALGGALARFAGVRVDELSWLETDGEVALEIEDEEALLVLAGQWRREGRELVAGPEQSARLSFPVREPWSSEFLAPLLPLVRAVRAGPGGDPARVRLESYRIALRGDARGVSGALDLDLGQASCELEPSFLALWPGNSPRAGGGEHVLTLRSGRVEYQDFRLPLEEGWIEVDGTYELGSAQYDLRVEVEQAGQTLDLGRLSGSRSALAPPRPKAPVVPGPQPMDVDGGGGG